jgi:hypothetical protein
MLTFIFYYVSVTFCSRVIEVPGTTSMGFQILIIANNLFEKILLHGSNGYEIVLTFKIFVLILQEGNYDPTLRNQFCPSLALLAADCLCLLNVLI